MVAEIGKNDCRSARNFQHPIVINVVDERKVCQDNFRYNYSGCWHRKTTKTDREAKSRLYFAYPVKMCTIYMLCVQLKRFDHYPIIIISFCSSSV